MLFYVLVWRTAIHKFDEILLNLIFILSEIIQGDACGNITKRRKLDEEHEKMTINVDTVGKRFQVRLATVTCQTGEYKVDLTRHPKFPLAFESYFCKM